MSGAGFFGERLMLHADTSGLDALAHKLRAIGNQAPHILRRAVNHTGDKARTAVVRSLVKATGARYGTVRRALRFERANYGRLVYRIASRGGRLSLKEFDPRQRRDGVSAKPWGTRRVFRQAFISAALGGHVFIRERSPHSGEGRGRVEAEGVNPGRVGRLPIRQLWGPAIPLELVADETRMAFFGVVAAELLPRAEHELQAILGGNAPRG